MDIKYTDIEKANKALRTTDVKGKDYVEVNQRVKAFRMVYPTGFIITKILEHDAGKVMMQTEAGYYDESGIKITLGTGLAFELQSSSFINKTSYIENCETSAVGRALGMAGFGIDASIASAEEVQNAQLQQKGQEAPKASKKAQKVTTSSTVNPNTGEPVDEPKGSRIACANCGGFITDLEWARKTTEKWGKPVCKECVSKKQAEAKAKKEAEAKKKAEEENYADLPFPLE